MYASNKCEEAVYALNSLAGLLELQGKDEIANRLHRRAHILLSTSSPLRDDRDSIHLAKEISSNNINGAKGGAKRGMMPEATAALASLAELHSSRGNHSEAIRLQQRVVELEEARFGMAQDSALAPVLLSYANILEAAGHTQQATCQRNRAAEIAQFNAV